jgi:hypothetical protein
MAAQKYVKVVTSDKADVQDAAYEPMRSKQNERQGGYLVKAQAATRKHLSDQSWSDRSELVLKLH